MPSQRVGTPVSGRATPYYGKRTTAQRGAMLLGVLIIEAIGFGIALSGFFPESARHASGGEFWGPFATAAGLAWLCLLGVHLVAFACLAPLVSHRWFDTFFLLVPVVSIVFWFRVVWRVTALPERYWPPRDEELPTPPRLPASSDALGTGAYAPDPRTDIFSRDSRTSS